MGAFLNHPSGDISVEGHTVSSLIAVRFLVGNAALVVFCFFCAVAFGSVRKTTGRVRRNKVSSCMTAEAEVPVARPPVAAHLRSHVASPGLPCDTVAGSSLLATPPKAGTIGPVKAIYRYSGQWLAGSQKHSQKRPGPGPPSVRHRQVPASFVEQAMGHQVGAESFSATRLLDIWQSTVHIHQAADGVVGAHPDALPLEDRPALADAQISFPWVPSSGFKFGLAHTLDVASAPVSPVVFEPNTPQPEAPLFKWGSVTHPLGKPLRGNKYARALFVWSSKLNVTTNVPFGKTSPLRPPCGADKENAFGSPQAVRALV
ncbi:hypothetical protein DFH06DRAFT_1323104 [Mycena polygramma]|nr:hypothetical protein DFH06DRAFT_1323104 [Mycena polygramma]